MRFLTLLLDFYCCHFYFQCLPFLYIIISPVRMLLQCLPIALCSFTLSDQIPSFKNYTFFNEKVMTFNRSNLASSYH